MIFRFGGVCALAALTMTSVCCSRGCRHQAVSQESPWTGRPGDLLGWGNGDRGIYGVLSQPAVDPRLLVVWSWRGDEMQESTAVRLPRSIHLVPVNDDLCGLSLHVPGWDGPWPYALLSRQTGDVVWEWKHPGWTTGGAGASTNGRFIAVLTRQDSDAPGFDWDKPRAMIGVVDVGARELRSKTEVAGPRSGAIGHIGISEDGRYVAVTGWNNGTAMVDAQAGKMLWAKKPYDEVSSGYAAFTPSGETVFTAGGEGCVYAMDVKTGEILQKRWATETGESIYGHRASALTVSPDGKWLAAGTGPEGQVYVWKLPGDQKPRILRHGGGTILIVSVSPDGEHIGLFAISCG